MRKYRTLCLFLTSVVSLSLLLVYRNEYNRLHYVLEVFDFFGQPCNFSELFKNDFIHQYKDWGPIPTWQQNEDMYTYSAFLINNSQVKVIALQSTKKEVARVCYLWFEDRETPVVGEFKSFLIEGNAAYRQWIYYYYCSLSTNKSTPYAVSFVIKKRNKTFEHMKKIMITSNIKSKDLFNITICVSPTLFSKKLLLEFISFHELIGIENFIFYLHDIPYNVSKLVSMLSPKLGIQSTFYIWNYPKLESNLSRLIVEKECLLRTFGKTVNTITLEIDEYIIPFYSHSLSRMLSEYNLKRKNGRLSFPLQKFCLENENPHQPIALQNFNAVVDNSTIVRYMYKSIDNDSTLITQMIEDTASIHKYIKCTQTPIKVHEDRSITRFRKDFVRSTLVQLLIHDNIK
ncbi:uncharacterized protein LOC108734113 [Agrilus planipennis]|uniref:Glycosyltransferase family 92 protein n=1 Tax=Agrilus planipennis TaxID=224129 RepID=A0A1W4WAH4_AGRPL|nr:uncharacterized protein LOC108734113 [Agrilus planipennis]